MTPLGNKQLGKLKANLKSLAALYTEEKISNLLIKDILNEVVDELNGISGTKDKDYYRESYTIPQLTKVVVNATLDTVTFTASTRRLVIPAATDGVTWSNETSFTTDWIGSEVIFQDILLGIEYKSVVESYVDANTVVLAASLDNLPDYDMDNTQIGNLVISRNYNQNNSIPIGTMAIFKYIDYITSIEDTVNEEVLKVDEKEFNQISREGSYSAYANSVIWTQTGDTLKFKKGTNVSVYGTRTMNIVRTPIPMATDSDYIDVRPANIPQVLAIALYRILKAKRVQAIPQDVMEAQTNLEKQKRAFMEEKLSEKESA